MRNRVVGYGPDEEEWWRQGIPFSVRESCVVSREADPYPPGEPYTYTTMIHLWKILYRNWVLFRRVLPDASADKKQLEGTFKRLNAIRNAVMHPVKRFPFTDEDFAFVEEVSQTLGSADKWKK